MEIWLTYQGDRLRLPITPYFSISYSNNNSEETLNELGTVNIAGKPGLRTIELTSFFPAQRYSFLESSDARTDPYYYDRKIRNWAKQTEPIRLIITETPHNFEVLIESYESGEQDGTGDVYFTLFLKEYKRVKKGEKVTNNTDKEKDVDVIINSPNNERFQSTKPSAAIKTVGEYDTPWTMAQKLTGEGDKNYKSLLKKVGDMKAGDIL